jgi:hypothetical protein
MEGAICDGRANAVCDPAEGRRDDGFAVPGVRYFAQNWEETTVTVPALTPVLHTDGSTSNLAADTSFPLPGQILPTPPIHR